MALSRRHARGHSSIDVICHKCSFCYKVEISGRRQQTDCPKCGAFAGVVDQEGGLIVKYVCSRCSKNYPVDVMAVAMAAACPECGNEAKLAARALLRRLAEVWRLRCSDAGLHDEPGLVNIEEMDIGEELLARLPRSLALAYRCVPIRFENGILTVAMSDAGRAGALEDLSLILGIPVRSALVQEAALEKALRKFYCREERGGTSCC